MTKPETPHDEAIALLTARGLYAKRRDWAAGDTVIVSRRTVPRGGLQVLDGAIYLVRQNGTWDLLMPLTTPSGYIIEHGHSTTTACERSIQYLQLSNDQIWQIFTTAVKKYKTPSLEFWYPDCLPLETAH